MTYGSPIFDQLREEWGHAPGELDDKARAELALYEAELAADPDPQVRESKVLAKLRPKKAQPVHVITVVPLAKAARLPDPEPIPGPDGPQEPPEDPEATLVVPKVPSGPQSPSLALLSRLATTDPSAVTTQLMKVLPQQ